MKFLLLTFLCFRIGLFSTPKCKFQRFWMNTADSSNNNIKLWDFIDPSIDVKTLKGHQESVTAIVISNELKKLYSASLDGFVKAWDLDDGTCQMTLQGYYAEGFDVSPEGMIATGGNNSIIFLLNAENKSLISQISSITYDISILKFGNYDNMIYVGGKNGRISLINLADNEKKIRNSGS
jgi:WD40 repeat protein